MPHSRHKHQSTLSFKNKSARITKSSTSHDQTAKKASSKLSEPAQEQIIDTASIPQHEPETAADTESEADQAPVHVAIRPPPLKSKPTSRRKTEAARSTDERELAAKKVTDAQVKKYWRAEEDSRLAPRVHQSHLSLHEKILRHFDLSSQYGPCIGLPRLARWKRANGLGLEPPIEVLAVLLREEDKRTSQGCGKLAYIDELGGGKMGLVE